MIRCYAYTRVSTAKQGEKGVSLQEQRAAIEQYASRRSIQIVEFFEERVTAAKQGRPIFNRMLKKLRAGAADGVIIHKIDRSARNLRDWAALGDLMDSGVAVHFANESVDLRSRGGRLSADIQAVVAADYVRNLREETLKGIYGRLKQGLFPFCAPLGYLNTGPGQLKVPDPERAPHIRDAFELYASGRHALDSLVTEMHRRGLRNRSGGRVCRTALSSVLNNRFYTGTILIHTTGETFEGKHEPIISRALFARVRNRLQGRAHVDRWKHEFTLRGLFHCSLCNHVLVGERQKGHVYYRCHTKDCPTKGFREEHLEGALFAAWAPIAATQAEKALLMERLQLAADSTRARASERRSTLQTQLAAIRSRRERLVDALVDGLLDRATFDERLKALTSDEENARAVIAECDAEDESDLVSLMEALELASSAQQSYGLASAEEKREMVIRLSSNRSVSGKEVSVEPHSALRALVEQRLVQ